MSAKQSVSQFLNISMMQEAASSNSYQELKETRFRLG